MNDEFHMHHGQTYLGYHYKHDVIDTFVSYLQKYPTEIIIVLVSTEFRPKNNTLPFYQVFLNYINEEHKDYWYLNDKLPTLGEVRGKLVLLRRFYSSITPLGTDMSGWRDSQTFHIQNDSSVKFYIQDEYRSHYTQKWSKFLHLIERSQTNDDENINSKVWFLNYGSATYWQRLNPPMYIAYQINKLLFDFLKLNSEKLNKPVGILMLDFVDHKIVRLVCDMNFLTKQFS